MEELKEEQQPTGKRSTQAEDDSLFNAHYAEFMATTQSLEDLLEIENDLLRHGKRMGLSTHQDRKEALAGELRTLFPKLLERPELLQGPHNAKRDQLIERVKHVQRLLSDNRALLNASKVATFRRIEAAVEARRQSIESGRRYDGSGEIEEGPNRAETVLMLSRKV